MSSFYFARVEECGRQMRAADAVASVALLLAHNPALQGVQKKDGGGLSLAGAASPRSQVPVVDKSAPSIQAGVPAAHFPPLPSPGGRARAAAATKGLVHRMVGVRSQRHPQPLQVPWHLVVGDDDAPSPGPAATTVSPMASLVDGHDTPASARIAESQRTARAGAALSDPLVLDLHGQHAEEAADIVRDALVRCSAARVKTLVLITGAADVHCVDADRLHGPAGRAHGWTSSSAGGRARGTMKRRVAAVLQQHKLDPAGLVVAIDPAAGGGGWAITVRCAA